MFGNTQEEVAVRVTTRGQVTIPLAIRQSLGIMPGTELSFRIRGSRIEIEKAVDGGRGAEVVRRLRAAHGWTVMSTDDLLALTRHPAK